MPKKIKYYPNNWKAFASQPDEFFLPLTYKEFHDWKIMGWAIPSSVACIIREEKDGKISEKIYSQSRAAKRYLDAEMAKRTKAVFTICDEVSVQQLRPDKEDFDEYHLLDELTDEEIDELLG